MKLGKYLSFILTLLCVWGASSLRGQVLEGQVLEPELGIYVDIDEEKWGAAQVNLRIVNNKFQMYFIDAGGLLVKPPIDDVIVHYGNFIKDSNARFTLVLKQEDMMLTAPRVISPPHRYMVRIFLKKWVDPDEYYKERYEVKEFIGMHIINQLGQQFLEASRMQPTSVPSTEGAVDAENSAEKESSSEDATELAQAEAEEAPLAVKEEKTLKESSSY